MFTAHDLPVRDVRAARGRKRGSVPLSSRRMLSRWVASSATAVITAATRVGFGALRTAAKIGSPAAAASDARETIRQRHAAAAKMASDPRSTGGASAANAPAAVATPFPPRNFANGEKMCPEIAARATAACTAGARPNRRATMTGKAPFAASSRSVTTPSRMPTARATLVAPMLPLPAARTSTPAQRPSHRPLGIDPRPKAARTARAEYASVGCAPASGGSRPRAARRTARTPPPEATRSGRRTAGRWHRRSRASGSGAD